MINPLRGDELLTCPHRLVLERRGVTRSRTEESTEIRHRRERAENLRQLVVTELIERGATRLRDRSGTKEALSSGVELLLSPVLDDDVAGRRRAQPHGLIRVGRRDETFLYVPFLVRNIEFCDPSTTRFLEVSSLAGLTARETVLEGASARTTPSIQRSVLALAHATRVLEVHGIADPLRRVVLIDRHQRAWWWSLAEAPNARLSMKAYDPAYEERRTLLETLDENPDALPSTPYWHRECVDCPYQARCRDELLESDDVSLVQFTSRAHQEVLHHLGVHTRRDLANLDPALTERRTSPPGESPPLERLASDTVEHLGVLIYRARSALRGELLRTVEVDQMGCPVADVEVDIDMESYEDRTYLWGATVRLRRPVPGLAEGYVGVVSWEHLDERVEGEVFARFWTWLEKVRELCGSDGASFRAYCFWAQAEDGAMNRALQFLADPALRARVEQFRRRETGEWIDLHDVVTHQIQTDGPTGLKKLARAAGFEWRDESPSGEASLHWYRQAVAQGPDSTTWRERLLQYNEDDCAATAALRDWLNGPASALIHRDDWPPRDGAS